jgi:hypothetical protein
MSFRSKTEMQTSMWSLSRIDFAPRFHQAYFRVKCGKAAFFERCMVHRTADFSVPGPILEQFPPDFVLGGDFTPRSTDWIRYPVSGSPQNYWFFGQFRNPAEVQWRPDAIMAHAYDIYDNGTLSTVQYDDTGGDRDLNDLIIEVAIVGRTPIGILTQAVEQQAATLHFEHNAARPDGRFEVGIEELRTHNRHSQFTRYSAAFAWRFGRFDASQVRGIADRVLALPALDYTG